MDVKHVAKLANLQLLPGEEEKFAGQFTKTIQTIDLINELDTASIEPTAQVTGLVNITRDDEIDRTRILPQIVVLSAARDTQNGYIKVPAVFDAQ
jgi:aspartyl-tRNA(Asn)/glutamyl-tRNA(Gln) amidotransferase subunit C